MKPFPMSPRQFKLLAKGLNPYATMLSRVYAPVVGPKFRRFHRDAENLPTHKAKPTRPNRTRRLLP